MARSSGSFTKNDPRINRKGRPKVGQSLAEKFRDALNESERGDYTRLDRLIDVAVANAKKGKFAYLEYVLARAYGKLPDRVEIRQEEEFDLSKLTDEEIEQLEAIRRKMNEQDS